MSGPARRGRLRRSAGRARRVVWETGQRADPVRGWLHHPARELRIAVACVYRTHNVDLVRAALRDLPDGATVRLWSLDQQVPADLAADTVGTGPGTRFALLNRLVDDVAPAARADGLILLDDDVRFVVGDVAGLVDAAAAVGLDLYQPAHTATSHANWAFVRRRAGLFARTTDFVEQGPVVGMSAAAQQVLLPLPEDLGMGWGVEVRWWSAALAAGLVPGIVDAVAIRHEGPTAQGYDRAEAEAVMARELQRAGLDDMRSLQRSIRTARRPRKLGGTGSPQPVTERTAQPSGAGAVSVVVPTYNRGRTVVATVRALADDPAVREVIVVDDGSSDETTVLLRALSARCPTVVPVRQPNSGAGRARQTGLERARGDIVLFLDDDVVPMPGLASGHLSAHRESAGHLVVGSMPPERPDRRSVHSVVDQIYATDYATCIADYERDPATVLDHLWAGNMSLARADALRVGVSDPQFDRLFFEDQDFGRRVRAAGMTAVFRPDLRAEHHHVGRLDGYLRDSIRQGQGMALLHERYPREVARPTARGIAGRFPPPARLLVALALRSPDLLGRLCCGTLLAAAFAAGVLRLRALQRALVVLLRRVGQARGIGMARRTARHGE